jgi:Fur family ferric uptake transcriptional regulator
MVGQRNTRQKAAIGELLEGLDEFRSAQQIHALLAARGADIGLATVYRTLGAMAGAGELDTLRTAAGESLFRRCARPASHHHHLVCRSCGRTVEVQGPNLESQVRAIAGEHGFVDVEHTLEFFGTCATCAAAG